MFTSGATESTNMCLKGVAKKYKDQRKHIITTQIDHKCTLQTCHDLHIEEDFEVTYLPLRQQSGVIDIQELKKALRPDTLFLSIIHVNNEIGVVQPLEEIG